MIRSILVALILAAAAAASPGWALDVWNREAVRARYLSDIADTLVMPWDAGWTGNSATCDAGTTNPSYRAATLRQLNAIRAMAGLADDIKEDPARTAKAQKAAVMFMRTGLSHRPPSTVACWNADAAEAAASSNLASSSGMGALASYMQDSGHPAPGHRWWLLHPSLGPVGIGDAVSGKLDQPTSWNSDRAANALTVRSTNVEPKAANGFIAWPPPGYVPSQLVYPLWSFWFPPEVNADFSNAQVSVLEGDKDLNAEVKSRVGVTYSPGFGNVDFGPMISWEIPSRSAYSAVFGGNVPVPSENVRQEKFDRYLSVKISGIKIDGTTYKDISYNVAVFDPFVGAALETGWYYDPREMGVGYALEQDGQNLISGMFLYRAPSGEAEWVWGVSIFDGSSSSSIDLSIFAGGPIFGSATPTSAVKSHTYSGNKLWRLSGNRALLGAGMVRALTRFRFGDGVATDFPTGWYWTPSEPGTGWFIEQQGSKVFAAIFTYASAGSGRRSVPTWWVFDLTKSAHGQFTGHSFVYAGGCAFYSSFLTCHDRSKAISSGTAAIYIQSDGSIRAVVGDVQKTLVRFKTG